VPRVARRQHLLTVLAFALATTSCAEVTVAKGVTGLRRRLLPADIKRTGVVRVGSDIEYPPLESYAEGTSRAVGLDVDLAEAMGQKLGVRFQFVDDSDFAGMLRALVRGRFDIVMSAVTDTRPRRRQGVDFVDYFVAGTSVLVQKDDPLGIRSLDDLCGQAVAVQRGTTQETGTLVTQSQRCRETGRADVEVLSFERDSDALQQVKAGRAAAVLEDSPVAGYNAKTAGGGADFEVVGAATDPGYYGIAVPARDPRLREALRTALAEIVADGTYDRVLARWGAAAGALRTAQVNGGS
jgi:polar amino acid transport system substrate-binding protein